MRIRALSTIFVLAALLTLACDTPKPDQPKQNKQQKDELPPDVTPQTIDQTLMKHLRSVAAKCQIELERGHARNCPSQETQTLDAYLRTHDPAAAVHTMVLALTDSDPKVIAVAANRMGTVLTTPLGQLSKAKIRLAPETAERFLNAIATMKGPLARSATPAAIHTAALAECTEKALTMLDGHQDIRVQTEGYSFLMTQERLAALPTLKKLAAHDDPRIVVAALRAPRNMHNPSVEEKNQICPWAKSHLDSVQLRVAQAAGNVMIWCRGPFIDALLDEGELRKKENRFRIPFSRVFRAVCFAAQGQEKPGSPKQCARNFAFLESVVNDNNVSERVRADSLWNIYHQRRDQTTLELMQKYERHDIQSIQVRAREAIRIMRASPNKPRVNRLDPVQAPQGKPATPEPR